MAKAFDPLNSEVIIYYSQMPKKIKYNQLKIILNHYHNKSVKCIWVNNMDIEEFKLCIQKGVLIYEEITISGERKEYLKPYMEEYKNIKTLYQSIIKNINQETIMGTKFKPGSLAEEMCKIRYEMNQSKDKNKKLEISQKIIDFLSIKGEDDIITKIDEYFNI